MRRSVGIHELNTRELCDVVGGHIDPLMGMCKVKIEDGEFHLRVVEVPRNMKAIQLAEMEGGRAEEIATFFVKPSTDVCEITENEYGKSLYCYDKEKYYKFLHLRVKEGNVIEVDASDESLHVQGWYKKVV